MVRQAGGRRLALTGSSTGAPRAAEIAKRFESGHPGVRVSVQTGGSARGIADARRGLCDIGMVSRDLTSDENDLQSFAVGRDGLAIITHSTNPVEELRDEEVVAIYRGATRNWQGVGGEDRPITVVNKAEGRATLEIFLGFYRLRNAEIHADVIIGDNEQGIKTVAGNPGAIGYVSVGAALHDRDDGVPIKLLKVRGLTPTLEAVSDGSYPFRRSLNLVTKGRPAGLVRSFLDYALSPNIDDLIKRLDYVPPQR